MVKGTEPDVSSAVKFLLFFLMFAVFIWGLHTKLSHYVPSKAASNSVTAKLLTDKSNEHSSDLDAEDVTNHPVERLEAPAVSATHTVSFSQLELYQVELSLCNSCRYDSDGPNSMHLPPPAIS